MNPTTTLWLSLGAAALAVLYGIFTVRWVLAQSPGNARMQEIAGAVQEDAKAYMNRQYSTIAIAGVVLFLILGLALNWYTAIGFAVGAIFSGLAGYTGMFVSVRANVRTAHAATQGLNPALALAFRGGAVTGLLVVGLGLLGVAGYYSVLHADADDRTGEGSKFSKRFLAFQRDLAGTLRLDVNENWLWKLEGHLIDGAADLDPAYNPDPKRTWGLFLIRTTVTF